MHTVNALLHGIYTVLKLGKHSASENSGINHFLSLIKA